MRLLVLLVGIASVPSAALAAPSAQVTIPSTDTQSVGTVHLAPVTVTSTLPAHPALHSLGLTAGLLGARGLGIEAGGDLDYLAGSEARFGGSFSADLKLALRNGALFKGSPSVAVGIYQLGVSKPNVIYVLMARNFGSLGRLSIGGFDGNSSVLVGPGNQPDNVGIMVSWDRSLNEVADGLWIGLDYQSTQSLVGAVSAGIYWTFRRGVSLAVNYSAFFHWHAGCPPFLTAELEFDTL